MDFVDLNSSLRMKLKKIVRSFDAGQNHSVLFVCIELFFFTYSIVITEEYGSKGEGRPMFHCS